MFARTLGARKRARSVAAVALSVVASGIAAAPVQAQGAVTPTWEGPIAGAQHNQWGFDLGTVGYQQDEYFISGTAEPGEPPTTFPSPMPARDGPAEYRTRFQVVRPTAPGDFNGNLFVEWVNVSAQFEVPTDFLWAHRYVFREGAAYVFVSVQEVGVCGNKSPIPGVELCTPSSLKGNFPERYESLHHPGDAYSFDIYRQVLNVLEADASELIGAPPEIVVAVGESQSAINIDQWICSPFLTVIDAYLSDADVLLNVGCTPPVPTIQLWSEESARDQETASENLRRWMIPGAPHVNRYANWYQAQMIYPHIGIATTSLSMDEYDVDIGRYGEEGLAANGGTGLQCLPHGNEFPRRYAVNAALEALVTWARFGQPAPIADPIEFGPLGIQGDFARDEHGNTLGGIRSPVLEVPVATYLGLTCGLFGNTIPFDPVKLQVLYGTHAEYVRQLHESIETSVSDGFLLPADAEDLLRRACASPVAGGPEPDASCPAVTAVSPYVLARSTGQALPTVETGQGDAALPATGGPATLAFGAVALLAAVWLRRRTALEG